MALQACMDSSDWLQGTMHEDESSGGGQGACSRPMMERKLKPPQDQAQKCPRCDSAHTKFCYYNNYSLTQPRYFCKTCRRYWTQGGTLRNIPVGGVCRRNTHKKHVAKKSSSSNSNDFGTAPANSINPADLHLSSLFGAHHNILSNNISPNMFDADRYNAVDFMDTKHLVEASRNYDFMGQNMDAPSFAGPFGMMRLEQGNNVNVHGTSGFMDSYRRMMLPYDADGHQNADVKPELMGIDHQWQEQGYLNNIGSWSGMMNTYGPSPANPLAYLITKL